MKVIRLDSAADHTVFDETVRQFLRGRTRWALTGAGISVESGIPDFRGDSGLWKRFPPEEFATIKTFRNTPEKAWRLYDEIGKHLMNAKPNSAHLALTKLETAGLLDGIITQNIDALHQAAGSRVVYDVHGTFNRLCCLNCDRTMPAESLSLGFEGVPLCTDCNAPLKPDIVLFGESVKHLHRIEPRLKDCDVLLVIGTSSEVYPAAGFPAVVRSQGGSIVEFNLKETSLSPLKNPTGADRLILGPASLTLTTFADRALDHTKA